MKNTISWTQSIDNVGYYSQPRMKLTSAIVALIHVKDPSITDQKIQEDLYRFESSDGDISGILYGDTNTINVTLDGGSLFVDVDLYEECK